MSTSTSPTFLITAASGNIGKHLIPLLLSQPSNPSVVLPTSNAERLYSTLPSTADRSRINVVEGNIQDPEFVEQTLKTHSVTGVFLCLTGDNELFTTLNFFDAIKQSGCVKHVVYLSACGDFSIGAIQRGVLQDIGAAHVAIKFMAEAKLYHGVRPRSENGGFSWTIIAPTLFFSNDLRCKQALLDHSFFDEPLGSKGVSRVDTGDIALGVAKTLIDDGQRWGGKKVMIGSLERYTNQDVATLWSKALGKQIRAQMSDEVNLKTYEKESASKASAAWGRDLRLMYETFESQGFGMTEEEYQEQVKLLGKEPESYEKFVEDTAKEWSGPAVPSKS
ncbi:NAD(P)-binding protein [Melanomma pulvis-pyrius CBS 109.77]|uniref:NAD(P)-binding protein n=1 Tax=Melanomma pulvis-pyrius CBS 109.77 TaxID=1314802 RepID=A0A6A6XQG2_9PLEO|nr:NAD(P)-binding protein [Melanomma pulvis-pyrius CBS 109.77]